MSSDIVRLSLPERILAEIGKTTSVRVRVTELSGVDRKLLIRALGNLGGPLPATEIDIAAGGSVRTEVSVSIPHGMPPGEHQYLFEVLDRDNGRVLESIDATVDIQHTRSVSMSVQPQSIRKKMRGKVRIVIRNHDEEPHKIRLRAEGDDADTKISLDRPGVIVRPGEMVRVPAKVRVKPYYIGKQKERFYSIIGEGAGVPVYARGNVRQKPMIGKNVKSLGLLGSIVIVWLTLTIAVIRLVSPATQEAAVGAETGTEQPGAGGTTPVSPLEPVLIDVNGTVTAVPDGSGVVVTWRPVSIGDVPSTTGKVAGGAAPSSPDVALQTTSTDADGKFVVAGLDGSGLYEFSFAKAGHQTQTKIVQPNGQPVTLEIALVAGSGTVGGIAVDEAGRPLGGVDITLTDGAITYGSSTPTDGDSAGRFVFNNLSSPGTYVLDAKVAGRGLASTTIELQTGQAITDVRLVLSRDVTALAGRIGSAAFESGVAAQSTTTPSPNLSARLPTFTVTATDGSLTRSTTTLSEGLLAGTFRLEQLPINRTYTVTYEAPGFLPFTEQIELRSDTPERQISMVRSTGRLRGTVKVQGSNLSPTSVAVTVTNPDFTYKATDAISSNGALLIDGIEPGRYVVLFEALGLQTQTREAVIGAGTSTTLDVTMSALASTAKASSLSFKVTKEGDATDATPVTATLMYRLSTDCGTGGEATNCSYTVGADGNLTVSGLEAGGYVVRFRATGYADKFVSAQVALQTAAPQVAVSITPLGTLQGMVADDTATPLQGIQVGLYADTQPPSNVPIATATTNATGEFDFSKKLEAKNYKVRVTSTAFVGTDRSVTGALAATLNLDLTVRGLATITGEVQEFDLTVGDTQSVAPARFAVFLRQGTNDATDLWQDAVNLGLGKSIGGFRLGVANNIDALGVRTGPDYDVCVILVSGVDTLASLQTYIGTQTLANHPCNLNNAQYRRSSANDITLAPTEIATRSAYFSPDPGQVTGIVTVSGAPLANVRVEARRVDQSDRIIESVSTKTAADGSFSFTRLTPVRPVSAFVPSGAGDTLVLTDYADHDSCDRGTGACWVIRASAENTGYTDSDYLAIYPKSNIAIGTLDIVQAQASSLSLTIRDTLGSTVNAATVKVNATTKCNANTPGGKCTVNDPAVGSEVTIEVSAVGYRTITTSIGIAAGTTAATITLVPVSSVVVTVQDTLGAALSGATASLVDATGSELTCGAATNGSGQCTITGAARGPAIVRASKNGVGAVTTFTSVVSDPSSATARLVADLANVSGQVTRASDGSGVGGVTVRLVQSNGAQVFSTTTAASTGNFFFGNVPLGDWTIELSAPGFGSRTGIAVTVPSGSYTVPSNLIQVSSDLVILTGIVSSGGSAVAGATVSLTSGSDIRSAITNAAGEYRFSGLTPSLWTIAVQSLGHAAFSGTVDGDSATQGDQALAVGTTTKNVTLSSLPGVLEMYTRTSAGNPINNIRVRVYASEAAFNADPATTLADVTSANGIAKAESLAAGQHWVVVTDATGVYASQSFVVNIDRGFTTQLPVYLGSTRAVVVIGLAGIPATGFGPQAALDLKVRLVDTADNSKIVGPVRTTINFDRGVATLVDVPIGTYSLQIDHDQPGVLNAFTSRADIVHAGTTYSVPAKTLSISAPGTRDEGLLLLHTKPAGLVVQAATDCADFNATKVNSFTAVLRDGYLLSPTAPTASNLGAASFTSIAPGTYAVELVSAGHLNRSVSLSVNDVSVSATTTHCVQMTPSAAVEVVPLQVTVRDSANALLAGAVATASPGGASCRTSADGTCTILTKPDSYSVSVAHDAHSTTSGGPVNVSSAAGGSVSVVMSTLSASIEFEAKTSAGATINAFAVDSVTDSKDCSATNGSCTVSAIADTNVRGFRISATGYEPTFVSTRVSGSSNKVVVVLEAIPATPSSDDRLLVHAFDPTNGTAITTFTVKNTVNDNVICSASGVSSCSSATPIPIGSISLKVEATGYEAGYGSSTITAESGSRLYIALYPKPTLQIRVRSSDANGPLAGVTVALSPAATNCAGGVTDSEGICNASGLAVGTTTITLSASHYFTTTAIVSISRGAASIDVTMRPKGSLTVTLKPQPAANTTVSIAGTALTCSVAGSATPAASADCTINDVPTGTWIITAPGHKSATATVARGTTTTVELVP